MLASLIAPAASTLVAQRAAHDLERRLHAGPQLEAEGALREQDLQAVDRVRAVSSRGGEQRRGCGAVDEIDDMRVATDLIERNSRRLSA